MSTGTPMKLEERFGPDQRNRAIVTAAIVALPAVVLAITAVARFLGGRGSIDLAVFDQGIWALSRGHAPHVSLIGESLLEDHFGPGFLSFALLYRLAATPLWLIGGQMVAGWAAAWLVARRLSPHLGHRRAGWVGAALLMSPPVAYALLFDVHAVVFAVPFALAAIFALEDNRPRRALLFGLLAALFRIELGVAVLAAFAVWPGRRRDRLGPGLLLCGYVLVAAAFESLLGHADYWAIHYGHLGRSPLDALTHPIPLVRTLLSWETLQRAFPWMATSLFLVRRQPHLAVPAVLVGLPVLLSQWPGASSIIFQYGFAPTFLFAVAAVPTIRTCPRYGKALVAAPIALALVMGPFFPPVARSQSFFMGEYWRSGSSELDCVTRGIPDDAGVSAGRAISLLAHRRHLYLWPFPFEGTPASVLPAEHLSEGNPTLAGAVDYIVISRGGTVTIPGGFEEDGGGATYVRYRRTATTTPRAVECPTGR